MIFRFCVLTAWIGLSLVNGTAVAQDSAGNDRGPRKRALLIGVGVYPHLPDSLQLRGPVNDVRLLTQVLSERLGFAKSDIVAMSDDSPPEMLPGRDNILREFRRLAADAVAGDEVFVYFSGHGTQQPDRSTAGEDDNEPDGLDEVLCTRDVAKITVQGGAEIPGGIVDDELSLLLEGPRSAGADVWVVLDSCHSGTAVRGDETTRGIPLQSLLPKTASMQTPAKSRGGSVRDSLDRSQAQLQATSNSAKAGRLVVLYAAQSNEPTVEKRLPRSGPDRKPHGLLTFSLAQSLAARPEGMSYQTLADRLQRIYMDEGRTSPTPWMEGVDLERPVLAADSNSTRELRLSRDRRGRSVVRGGTFDDLTPGTILKVFDEAGVAKGCARIVEADLFGAVVEPCSFETSEEIVPLPDVGRVAVVAAAAPQVVLRIYAEQALLRRLRNADPDFVWPKGLEQVDEVDDAELVLRGAEDKCLLTSTTDQRVLASLPPADMTVRDVRELLTLLTSRVRAKRLLAAAASSAEAPETFRSAGVRFELQVLTYAHAGDRTGRKLEGPAELRDGEIVGFEVRNLGLSAIDVTLLLVDSTGRLLPVFPQPGREGDARVPIGKSLRTPRAVVEADEAGVEHLVVIAVAADGAPRTFAWAAEAPHASETEAATRQRGGTEGTVGALQEILTGNTMARGGTTTDMSVTKTSWRISP